MNRGITIIYNSAPCIAIANHLTRLKDSLENDNGKDQFFNKERYFSGKVKNNWKKYKK